MSENNKSYRLRTEVGRDTHLNLNINQTFDNLEILSLKIGRENLYRLHTAGYGCVVGRVVANGNFGIPNAKVSIFISADTIANEDSILSYLYPYTTISSKNDENIRYNLLTEEQISDCHRNVGTFPTKRRVLDDANVLEVFDKYYKFTTTTNASGDFMLFGVPVGNQFVHTDIDLSDIGILSQKPRDMVYKGYTITQFENANQFKSSTDLDSLTQIISENTAVYVYPFWGDENEGEVKITRSDVEVNYKFEPTCIFMGSLISDDKSEGISKKCIPTERMGKMDRLTTGQGTIEMIRKKPDGSVEEFSAMGNQLIDGNGTWCYQIPMNLDYMSTDEYGNLVPTDDPSKGIPTRTRVRFRVSLNDFDSDYENNHLSKLLVPNNPKDAEHLDYVFGTNTQDEEDGTGSFRDLFWNNVYTVKSYIPRIQKGNNQRNKRFTGIKQVNVNNGNNPLPYNNMRVHITFMFTLQCAILKLLITFARVYNKYIVRMLILLAGLRKGTSVNDPTCMTIGDGVCPDLEGWYFAPGCGDYGGKAWRQRKPLENTVRDLKNRDTSDEKATDATNADEEQFCLTNKIDYLMQCIEINLAMEYDVIQFDFYNDWLNGVLYIPRWFVNFRKKRSYLFGLIRRKGKIQACMEGSSVYTRRFVQQCALEYVSDSEGMYHEVVSPNGCKNNDKSKCHKAKGRKYVKIFKGTKHGGGIVHNEKNMNNKNLYYFRPAEWINNGNDYKTKCNLFATDIVLLGSLKDCDINGIPQAFKELTSSSYQLPGNLASTNMDSYGFMYGFENGTMCTNTYSKNPITVQEDTFSSYRIWQNRQDFKETEPNLDPTEYPITETAGIDWGYYGPGQKAEKGKNRTLYNPGGHFLGISCKNAEVNIKSCVNLSRICEVGSMMSQRQAVMKYDYVEGQAVYSWAYLVPTGLISKDEISDANFRNIFATMNHNHLATETDKENGYRRYKMTAMYPTNFEGELESKIGGKDSAYYSIFNETNERGETETHYRRALEENSRDYYLFRLGGTGKDKFLINQGGKVSLPVYDNSFYFYFGLINGATAFDRFMSDYYAQCPTRKAYESKVEIMTTNATLCKENDGEISVKVNDVEAPFSFDITDGNGMSYNLKETADKGVYEAVSALTMGDNSINAMYFKVRGLRKNDYAVSINGSAGEDLEQTFSIGEALPEEVEKLKVYATDFVQEEEFSYDSTTKSMNGNFTKTNGGYIEIYSTELSEEVTIAEGKGGITCVYVYNDEYFKTLFGNTSAVPSNIQDTRQEIVYFNNKENEKTDDKIYFSYLWKGNDDFTVGIVYHCTNGKNANIIKDTVTANMEGSCDFYIGDSDCTGRQLRNAGYSVSENKWYEKNEPLKKLTSKEEWSLRKGLTYNGSLYNRDGGKITVGLINAVPPTTIRIVGDPEMTIDEDANSYVYVMKGPMTDEEAAKSGYTVDIGNIQCPTVLDGLTFKGNDMNSLEVNGFTLLNANTKNDYNYVYYDSSNSISGEDEGTDDGTGGGEGGGGDSGSTINPPIKQRYTVKTTLVNAYFVSAIYNGETTYWLPKAVNEGDKLEQIYFRAADGYKITGSESMAGGGDIYRIFSIEEKPPVTKIGYTIPNVTGNITFAINGTPIEGIYEPRP